MSPLSMPPLALLLLLTLGAAGLGFAVATARSRAQARREPKRPPRGFKPVVIEGGKPAPKPHINTDTRRPSP